MVIEAIFENLEAKQALYAQLEPRMKPTALLATNTSSITLEPLAEKLANPARLVGLHFFNPVPQMPLIEIVSGARTDAAAAQAAISFARRLDKLPVPCKSAPGFIVNRVLMPYLHEAMYAAQEGVPLALIDKAAVDFGMPMGPVELADVVGLDVASHVGKIIAAELGRPAPDLAQLESLVAQKKLGRKSGSGFYEWKDGKAVKPPAEGRAAARSHRSADPRAGERMRGGAARRRRERSGLHRCRGYFRYGLRAVPGRPDRLCAQPRHSRGRGTSRGARGAIRFSFSAGRGLEHAGRCGKSVNPFRSA